MGIAALPYSLIEIMVGYLDPSKILHDQTLTNRIKAQEFSQGIVSIVGISQAYGLKSDPAFDLKNKFIRFATMRQEDPLVFAIWNNNLPVITQILQENSHNIERYHGLIESHRFGTTTCINLAARFCDTATFEAVIRQIFKVDREFEKFIKVQLGKLEYRFFELVRQSGSQSETRIFESQLVKDFADLVDQFNPKTMDEHTFKIMAEKDLFKDGVVVEVALKLFKAARIGKVGYQLCETFLALHPDNFHIRKAKGMYLYYAGKPKEAKANLELCFGNCVFRLNFTHNFVLADLYWKTQYPG